MQWLGYEEANQLDKRLLGGVPLKDLENGINSPTLRGIIKRISEIDQKRAREILSFYEDFNKCIKNLDKVMKRGGYVCFVVGNRTVKKINIPTDKIMVEMFQAQGNYKHITTYTRAIPYKRMPKMNSPSNIKGDLVPTMNNEFIFVLQKA